MIELNEAELWKKLVEGYKELENVVEAYLPEDEQTWEKKQPKPQ